MVLNSGWIYGVNYIILYTHHSIVNYIFFLKKSVNGKGTIVFDTPKTLIGTFTPNN